MKYLLYFKAFGLCSFERGVVDVLFLYDSFGFMVLDSLCNQMKKTVIVIKEASKLTLHPFKPSIDSLSDSTRTYSYGC